MQEYTVEKGIVYNDNKTKFAVLYSKAYRCRWNVFGSDKKEVMFYLPLIEYLLKGCDPRDLVKDNELTNEGKELFKDLFEKTKKKFGMFEDLKNVCIFWVPVNKKFRVHEYDGYEKVELYCADDWLKIKKYSAKI